MKYHLFLETVLGDSHYFSEYMAFDSEREALETIEDFKLISKYRDSEKLVQDIKLGIANIKNKEILEVKDKPNKELEEFLLYESIFTSLYWSEYECLGTLISSTLIKGEKISI